MISLICGILKKKKKTPELKDTKKFVVARGAGASKIGEWGQKVQFQLQSKCHGDVEHSMVIIANNTVFHI